jgi:uncharacterized membrane protein required for colicin V production
VSANYDFTRFNIFVNTELTIMRFFRLNFDILIAVLTIRRVSMFFDILILIIIVACAVFGFRNGFLISLSRIGGWIGALLIAFFFHKRFGDWLIEHTSFYENTQLRVQKVCETFVTNYTGDSDPSAGAGGFGATLDRVGESLAKAAAEQITSHLWTVIVFVMIVFGIKIILFVLTLLLSKRFHGGMIGGIDGVAGLLFGLFQAIVAILVVFALLLPISYTVSAKTHDNIERSMSNSIVAELIYENNPLLDFIDGFLPTGLTPDKWLNPDHYENVLYGGGGKTD